MTKFKNRIAKIAFLEGLKKGTRSLDEIVEPGWSGLSYDDVNGNVVIRGAKGVIVSREEAQKIRNRNGQNLIIYILGEANGPAHNACDEDASTNPKSGKHIIYTPQAGNAPLAEN